MERAKYRLCRSLVVVSSVLLLPTAAFSRIGFTPPGLHSPFLAAAAGRSSCEITSSFVGTSCAIWRASGPTCSRTRCRSAAKTKHVLYSSLANQSSTGSKASVGDEVPSSLNLLSPCKINLFLRIIRKRPDGYHDLASLFQTIGFGDTLNIQRLPDGDGKETDGIFDEFTCNMDGVPLDKSNLVLRAVDLMRERTGIANARFKIDLKKQVPAQAGLGGGSANAATAMFAVNELLGRPATHGQLVDWSAELGSDITFFFSLGSAYCTGRGEIMTPLVPPPFAAGTKLTIVKPTWGLSTPSVFKALDYAKLSAVDPEELLDRFKNEGVIGIGQEAYINDLEPPAFSLLPDLEKLKRELQEVSGFCHVCMSGSGTSIFCIGEPEDLAAFEGEFGSKGNLKIFHTEFITREGEGTWWGDDKS